MLLQRGGWEAEVSWNTMAISHETEEGEKWLGLFYFNRPAFFTIEVGLWWWKTGLTWAKDRKHKQLLHYGLCHWKKTW